MSSTDFPYPEPWHPTYIFFDGPLGERFAALSRVLSEAGHYRSGGDHSRDVRMLQDIASAHEVGLRRIKMFTVPERWAIEKLVSVEDTPRGPKTVLRRPRVDMDIGFTSKGNLAVDWRPRYVEDDDSEYGDFRITEYETRKEPFQRPFFEAFYLPGLYEYADAIKRASSRSRQGIMTEIARLAVDCARDIYKEASSACDVRLDGRLEEVINPDTRFLEGFRYTTLAVIKREAEEKKQQEIAERLAAIRQALDEFKAGAGMSAQWFCQYVEHRREEGATYGAIAEELEDSRRSIRFAKGSTLSLYRDLSGKLTRINPDWRAEGLGAPAIPPKKPAVKASPIPTAAPIKTAVATESIKAKVAGRITAQRESRPAPAGQPREVPVPDYSRLRRYANGSAVLGELGFSSVDDLVAAVNERRADMGRLPITQGDFPANKATFDKLVREFGTYSEAARPNGP